MLHPVGSECMGRQAQTTPRQRRDEARSGPFSGTRREVRATLDRSRRVSIQHPTTKIQRMMERPDVRSGGRAPPIIRQFMLGKLLVQPP
jgi:hypothetical protein